jgi:molecular chaperone DnaK (HSP70)
VSREEFQQVFDERVDKIFQLVDSQIKQLQNTHARETIDYLILSGGLGSSPYLKHRMRQRYQQDANPDLYNARNLTVLVAPEP